MHLIEGLVVTVVPQVDRYVATIVDGLKWVRYQESFEGKSLGFTIVATGQSEAPGAPLAISDLQRRALTEAVADRISRKIPRS